MWARGASKNKAESWNIGDILRYKREVRNKKPFNKHFDAERNHELIYAGRFFEINPDRAIASSVHTIIAVSWHESNKEAHMYTIRLRPDGETVQHEGVQLHKIELLHSISPYEGQSLSGAVSQDSWITLRVGHLTQHWAGRTKLEYQCLIWVLYQTVHKMTGKFPMSSIDANELDKMAQVHHFRHVFGCQSWGSGGHDAKSLVDGESTEGRMFTAQEEKELDNILKDFDIDSANISEFEREQITKLGIQENHNIKRFLEAQQVARSTHSILDRAQGFINEIETKMKQLEKKSLRRPTQDLVEFKSDSALLETQSQNEERLLIEIQSVLARLKLEDDEETLLKQPFPNGETKNLNKLVATIQKLIDGIELNQESEDGLKRMNIVREKLDEFVRLSDKLNDATEVFMTDTFIRVKKEALAEDYSAKEEFGTNIREQTQGRGSAVDKADKNPERHTYGQRHLRELTDFMRKFCSLEEMLGKRNDLCLNFQLADDYAQHFGEVYDQHFEQMKGYVMSRACHRSRDCDFLEMRPTGNSKDSAIFVGSDVWKVRDGEVREGECWHFADLLEEDSKETVPIWVALAALIRFFLDKAYTESLFLDKFFSLGGDTENDASDKFRLMDALFQAVEQYFRDAIAETNGVSEQSCLILSLIVADVRKVCDQGDMNLYLLDWLACMEMDLQYQLNKYMDSALQEIVDDSPSASGAGILRAVFQLPVFFSHLIHTARMVSSFDFLQGKGQAGNAEGSDEEGYDDSIAPASWLAANLLEDMERKATVTTTVDSDNPDALQQSSAIADKELDLYILDNVAHKMLVTVFNQIDSVAAKDVRYKNVVILQNSFKLVSLLSEPGILDPLASTMAPYIDKGMQQYYEAVDEYVRWLVTCELRVAMAYFDEVDALLKSKRQTEKEIHYCHPFKEFKEVVESCLIKPKIKKLLKRIFNKVFDHLDDWMVIACVSHKIEEYFVTQFSQYLKITQICFPTYKNVFKDLKVEDLRTEVIPRQLFKMCMKGRKSDKKRQQQHEQWLDVDTTGAWFLDFPVDLKKPRGPRRRVAGQAVVAVKKKLLEGRTSWDDEPEVLSSDAEEPAEAEDAQDEHELEVEVGDKVDQ